MAWVLSRSVVREWCCAKTNALAFRRSTSGPWRLIHGSEDESLPPDTLRITPRSGGLLFIILAYTKLCTIRRRPASCRCFCSLRTRRGRRARRHRRHLTGRNHRLTWYSLRAPSSNGFTHHGCGGLVVCQCRRQYFYLVIRVRDREY